MELVHRVLLVPQLAALPLAGDDDSGLAVAEADRGVPRVHVLSAGSAGAIRLHLALGKKLFIGLRYRHGTASVFREYRIVGIRVFLEVYDRPDTMAEGS